MSAVHVGLSRCITQEHNFFVKNSNVISMKMLLSFDCKFAMFTIVMSNNVNEFFFN